MALLLMLKRHNPLLESRLAAALQGGPEALAALLQELRNADFRTAGYLLGEKLLPALDSAAFWALFVAIVPQHPKAYLGTFLKASATLYRAGRLNLGDARFASFAAAASPVDCRKTLEALLPVARTADDCALLMRLFGHGAGRLQNAQMLVAAGTPMAYYELLQELRRGDGSADDERAVCLALLRRGDSRSFRMARLVQAYFGLEELPATFSFHVENYQLSRLEGDYEQFLKMLEPSLNTNI